MEVGDIIRCRGKKIGIIVSLQLIDGLWGQIMWSDSTLTWEDLLLNIEEDEIFEIIN